MCGLTGFTARSSKSKINPTTFILMMAANDSRGGDSTGYWDGEGLTKCVGDSAELYQKMQKLESNFVIGHTRKATHGSITEQNQHPFKYGDVVGAHNGVLRNYVEVGEKFNIDETDVDSQMIFKVLKKTRDLKSLGLFSGALAVLFTMGDGKFYSYRHNNPMWVGKDDDGNAYFSSLKEPLLYAGMKDLFQLKEDRVYVWEKGEVTERIDIAQAPIPSKPVYTSPYGRYGGYDWGKTYKHKKKKKIKSSKKKSSSYQPQLSLNVGTKNTSQPTKKVLEKADEFSFYNDDLDYNRSFGVEDEFQTSLETQIENISKINNDYDFMFYGEDLRKMEDIQTYLTGLKDEFYGI